MTAYLNGRFFSLNSEIAITSILIKSVDVARLSKETQVSIGFRNEAVVRGKLQGQLILCESTIMPNVAYSAKVNAIGANANT